MQLRVREFFGTQSSMLDETGMENSTDLPETELGVGGEQEEEGEEHEEEEVGLPETAVGVGGEDAEDEGGLLEDGLDEVSRSPDLTNGGAELVQGSGTASLDISSLVNACCHAIAMTLLTML